MIVMIFNVWRMKLKILAMKKCYVTRYNIVFLTIKFKNNNLKGLSII